MVGGLFYDRKREVMTDYQAVYAKASRENAPGIGRDNFDAGIAAVVAAAKAEALGEFACELRERYPEDVFKPLTDKDHCSANDALAGRSERTHITRDRISADMMRFAAVQCDDRATEYRAASLAAAHTTDLREQSKLYAVKAMPDGVGE